MQALYANSEETHFRINAAILPHSLHILHTANCAVFSKAPHLSFNIPYCLTNGVQFTYSLLAGTGIYSTLASTIPRPAKLSAVTGKKHNCYQAAGHLRWTCDYFLAL